MHQVWWDGDDTALGVQVQVQVQGLWRMQQLPWHINLKEIEAARLSLKELMKEGDMVRLYMDSQAVVAFVNRQGGTCSRILCASALDFWQEVLNKKGWIGAGWLPREYNEQADFLLKHKIEVWDFRLRPDGSVRFIRVQLRQELLLLHGGRPSMRADCFCDRYTYQLW